jgi:hypothetical protein
MQGNMPNACKKAWVHFKLPHPFLVVGGGDTAPRLTALAGVPPASDNLKCTQRHLFVILL